MFRGITVSIINLALIIPITLAFASHNSGGVSQDVVNVMTNPCPLASKAMEVTQVTFPNEHFSQLISSSEAKFYFIYYNTVALHCFLLLLTLLPLRFHPYYAYYLLMPTVISKFLPGFSCTGRIKLCERCPPPTPTSEK